MATSAKKHRLRPRARREQSAAARRPDTARLIDDLDALLIIGDFETARKKLDEAGPAGRILSQIPDRDNDRMRAAAVLVEILFTYGHDEEAQVLLEDCATHPDAAIASSMRARHKLQLAEYHYSLFDAERAHELGARILDRAEEDEKGECHYYLARFALRRNRYSEASEHCIKGMEAFHRTPGTGVGNKALYWQTGRLLRVRGTALWLLGRLSESTAVLYLSAWVLRETDNANKIHVGDTFHALGRLLRTSGPERYEQAIDAVKQACEHYAQAAHDLKQARAETDLARAQLNKGLRHHRRNEQEDAKKALDECEQHLETSLRLTHRYQDGAAPVVWQRERLNALVWSSWLHQEAPANNPTQAFRLAEAAVNLATNIAGGTGPEGIEAALAFANSAMLVAKAPDSGPKSSELLARAETHIQNAANVAKTLENKKLEYHALLRLAQLRCRQRRNYEDAKAAFDQAKASMQDHQDLLVPGGYLDEQTRVVEAEIASLGRAQKHFLYTEDDLRTLQIPVTTKEKDWSRLKVLRARADKWALEAALREMNGDEVKAADWLDISLAAVRNIRKWDEEVTRAQAVRRDAGQGKNAGDPAS